MGQGGLDQLRSGAMLPSGKSCYQSREYQKMWLSREATQGVSSQRSRVSIRDQETVGTNGGERRMQEH